MISILLAGCPGSAASVTEFTVDAYLIAVEDIETEYVASACRSFLKGEPRQYAPSASELATRAKLLMPPAPPDPHDMADMRNLTIVRQGMPIPAGLEPAGQVSVDFGHGRVSLLKLSYSEQEAVFAAKRLPKGKDMVKVRSMRRAGYTAGDDIGRDD